RVVAEPRRERVPIRRRGPVELFPDSRDDRATRFGRRERGVAIGQFLAVAAQAALLVDRRQLQADAREIDARGLLDLLDRVQRAVLVRQRGIRFAEAQLAFGL